MRIDLSTVYRETSRGVSRYQRAECDGEHEEGYGSVISKLLKRIEDKHPADEVVEVWRGKTRCFHPVSLKRWLEF